MVGRGWSVRKAEEKEDPSVLGGHRESFTEENLLELRLEQLVSLQSTLAEKECRPEAWWCGKSWEVTDSK